MTPGMEQSLTLTQELTPEVKQEIALILSVYQELKVTADVVNAQLDEEKASIFQRLKDAGVDKAVIDDISLCIVGGSTSSLDKKKFVQLGGSLKLLDEATIRKPRKEYLRIGESS